jgi:hypothetical protein
MLLSGRTPAMPIWHMLLRWRLAVSTSSAKNRNAPAKGGALGMAAVRGIGFWVLSALLVAQTFQKTGVPERSERLKT